MQDIIANAAEHILSLAKTKVEIGVVLGSGLGDYADKVENAVCIPYRDLPGFPTSSVEGHKGQFVVGEKHGRGLILMQGRFHYYEGYTQRQLAIPIRVIKRLGAGSLLLTNAAGGVNMRYASGALMLISDHINYSGANPLVGPNLDEYGPRFPDMSRVYSGELRQKAKAVAEKMGIALEEGVYMMFSGPSYETPAEIRMARVMGADAVGMSTVPEAIAAAHASLPCLGISCITNMAAGVTSAPLVHAEVMETANRVKATFEKLVDELIREVL